MANKKATTAGTGLAPRDTAQADTRERLLSAAVDLFLAHGYPNLRIGDITEAAGLGKGTFYLYFRDKRDLLLAYFQDVNRHIDSVEAEVDTSGLDYLQRAHIRMRSALDPEGRWHKILTFLRISANSNDPEVAAAARATHSRMAEAARKDMARAIEQGLVRPVDPSLATLAWAGMQEMLAWRGKQDDAYDSETIIASAEDLFRHAFLCDPELPLGSADV